MQQFKEGKDEHKQEKTGRKRYIYTNKKIEGGKKLPANKQNRKNT